MQNSAVHIFYPQYALIFVTIIIQALTQEYITLILKKILKYILDSINLYC